MRQLTVRSILTPSLIMLGAAGALAAAPAPAYAPVSAPTARIVDGYVVTQRVTSQGQAVTLKIKVAQGKIRIEMEGGPQGMPPGMFMLARDDGKIVMVMASQGMAMVINAAEMANMGQSMARAMGRGGAGEPTVSDVSVNVEDLGAGEKLLGYSTRKYKVQQRHTSTAGATATKNESVMELWMATDLPGLSEGLTKFAETFGAQMGGIGGGPDQLKSAMTGKIPKGYPLKSIITSTTTAGGGAPRTDTVTLEVTDVTKVTFDAADFEVPAGVQVMDMATMMRGRGGR